MRTHDAARQESRATAPKRGARRKLAEWVSLAASALLILTLAGHLVMEAFRANGPFVQVEVEARLSEVREVNGRFILPVRVTNGGGQTLRDVKIELRSQGPDARPLPPTELLIDYLGEASGQETYFYFDQHPSALKVEARAISYRVE